MHSNPESAWFTVLLGICAGLPALSIDLSAPILPILPDELHTTVFVAGLSLSLFMAGFALGQFVGGRTSDRLGRRPVLLVAVTIYTIAGLCCIIATSGGQLATARLVQGVGAGACAVQASAIVQDLFLGEEARRKQASVSIVLTIVPMLAPALGAVLVGLTSWRAAFVALVAGGILLGAALLLFMRESRPPDARARITGLGLRDSVAILRDGGFLPLILVNGFSYGTIFAYIAGAPVVVMRTLGYSTGVYVGLFATTAVALTAGATCNAMLGRRGFGSADLVWPALIVQAISTLALAGLATVFNDATAGLAIPLLWAGAFARGIVSPNMIHLAVSRHRHHAGLASALVGLSQLLLGAAASAAVAALLQQHGYAGVALPMAALSCAAVLLWRMTVHGTDGPTPNRA